MGARRGGRAQISDAIARVHKARREILPPSDEFLDAPIDPRLAAWVTKWEWNRMRQLEWLEKIIEEFPLEDTVGSLEWMTQETIVFFEVSAKKYRLEMDAILDEE